MCASVECECSSPVDWTKKCSLNVSAFYFYFFTLSIVYVRLGVFFLTFQRIGGRRILIVFFMIMFFLLLYVYCFVCRPFNDICFWFLSLSLSSFVYSFNLAAMNMNILGTIFQWLRLNIERADLPVVALSSTCENISVYSTVYYISCANCIWKFVSVYSVLFFFFLLFSCCFSLTCFWKVKQTNKQ